MGSGVGGGHERSRAESAVAGEETPDPRETAAALATAFGAAVDRALGQLRTTDPATVFDRRGVGRAGVPSTVLGLLVHAAEHTMRHVGQLSVTARVVSAGVHDAAAATSSS